MVKTYDHFVVVPGHGMWMGRDAEDVEARDAWTMEENLRGKQADLICGAYAVGEFMLLWPGVWSKRWSVDRMTLALHSYFQEPLRRTGRCFLCSSADLHGMSDLTPWNMNCAGRSWIIARVRRIRLRLFELQLYWSLWQQRARCI